VAPKLAISRRVLMDASLPSATWTVIGTFACRAPSGIEASRQAVCFAGERIGQSLSKTDVPGPPRGRLVHRGSVSSAIPKLPSASPDSTSSLVWPNTQVRSRESPLQLSATWVTILDGATRRPGQSPTFAT
jgi:hypothetical protein